MMAWAGEYYGETLHEERGVSQGNPLFPNIFNVVVDAVVCHWEYLVAGQEGGIAEMTTYMGHRQRGGKSGTKMTDNGGQRRGIQV